MPASEYIKQIRAKIGKDLLLLPGVTTVVVNSRDEVLLQLRRDTKTWAPPSGGLEPGENLAQCAIREVLEESGIEVIPESIVAVLSGDEFTTTYANGDQIGVVACVFRCRPRLETAPRVNDDESLEMRYFPAGDLPAEMLPRHRWIVAKGLENNRAAYFNPPS